MLLVDKKISTARDIVGVLEGAIRGGYPLMIMAEEIEQEALATLVVNKLRGRYSLHCGAQRCQATGCPSQPMGGVCCSVAFSLLHSDARRECQQRSGHCLQPCNQAHYCRSLHPTLSLEAEQAMPSPRFQGSCKGACSTLAGMTWYNACTLLTILCLWQFEGDCHQGARLW